jgi:O-antigen/teichoic acid export membrane protein
MSSLVQKTFAGLLSTGFSKVILAAVGFAVTLILARQLEPKDFGLIGMAGVFTAFLSMLGGLGFDNAIIQRQQLSGRQLSTLFWIKIGVGLLCSGLLFLAAPVISGIYREPRLAAVIQALSLIFVISSVYQTHRSTLRKQLRFSAVAVNSVVSVLVSGGVGVTVAFLGGGVWSLVAQALAMEFVSAILYWWCNPWRPGWVWAWRETVPVLRFGLTMAAGSFVLYLQRNIDALLIGWLLGATALGYYALAYRIMYSPVRQISYVFTDVLFPSLSTIQNDVAAVRRGYTRSVKCIALVTFPAMTLVALFAADIVEHLFGAQWAPAAVVIGILAPAGALQSVTQLAYVVFPVMGRPRLCVMQYLCGCGFLAAGVIIGFRWGVNGTAWGVLGASVAGWCLAQVFVNRLLAIRLSDALSAFGRTAAACAAMALVAFALDSMFGQAGGGNWALVAHLCACLAAYAIVISVLERQELLALRDLAVRSLAGRRRAQRPA